MTAHHPSRRWHGCPLCKSYKNDANGDPERRSVGENVQMGTPRRWQRNDIPEHEHEYEERSRKGKRKDTKTWCKGKVGREHDPMVVFRGDDKWRRCRWVTTWAGNHEFWCFHESRCRTCNKILDRYKHGWHGGVGDDCPVKKAATLREKALKQYVESKDRVMRRHHKV